MRAAPRSQLGGLYDRTPAKIVTQSPWDLLPGGARMKGVNIPGQTIKLPADPTFDAACWAVLWRDWPWAGWMQPQIDDAKAIGCNTIHPIGTFYGRPGIGSPSAFTIDDATYYGQWRQLLDYCRAQGLFVYASLGGDTGISDYGSVYGFTPTVAAMTAECVRMARLLQTYCDVVCGVDLHVESMAWSHNAANSVPVYNAVKAAAPKLSYTWSANIGHPAAAPGSNYPAAGAYDHLNVHFYNAARINPDAVDAALAFYAVPILIGEFGMPASDTTLNRQNRYNDVSAVQAYTASGRKVAGCHAWCMRDQDTTTTANEYGLFTQAGAARSDIESIFAGFTT